MDSWTEKRDMVRVAKLYYFQGMTQQEIAKKIGVSRPVISKLLQKARETGIVEITIHDETVSMVEMEQQLESLFRLKEVFVVPVRAMDSDETLKQLVAKVAAQHLSSLCKAVSKIGISWGTTLYAMVNEFPYERHPAITVYPLVGGIGRDRIEIHSNQLAYELAKKLGGKCQFLYAPAMAETVELRKQLTESTDIRMLLEEIKTVDVAVVSVGNPYESTMLDIGYLKSEDIEELKRHQAVGDIASRFIQCDGEEINSEINSKVIGIQLADLRNIPTVIGVISGVEKVDATLAVLRGGYLDTLIIDERAAKELLKKGE